VACKDVTATTPSPSPPLLLLSLTTAPSPPPTTAAATNTAAPSPTIAADTDTVASTTADIAAAAVATTTALKATEDVADANANLEVPWLTFYRKRRDILPFNVIAYLCRLPFIDLSYLLT
jgi:hypothetical protein